MMLPVDFTSRMREQLGNDFSAFEDSLNSSAPVSIRVNTQKWSEIPSLEPIPWAGNAFYLKDRPVFTLDPLLHAGAYYVQEASSMFLEQAVLQNLEADYPLLALDLCGAPGGKSTHLSSLLPEGSLLVGNEVIRSRTNILVENTQKWGSGNIVVTQNDPRDFESLPDFFDLIVVDAPCSGEGLFRRDPAAATEWSENNVKLCSERQRRILSDIWPCLKPGGILVYSTCTFNLEENEDNLQWLFSEKEAIGLPVKLDPKWGVSPSVVQGVAGYRFYPHKTVGEGLFMAVVQKPERSASGAKSSGKRKKPVFSFASKASQEKIKGWITSPENWFIIQYGTDKLAALPKDWLEELEIIFQQLRIAAAGIPLAEVKNVQYNPLPSLALSFHLNKSTFPIVEVDSDTALRYLKKEDVSLPDGPEGWVILAYRNTPMGFIKNMKHRANNYWPKEWRIRMDLGESNHEIL